MKKLSFLSLVLFLVNGCSSPEHNWVYLFNGIDFQGWHTYNKGKIFDGWYVENSELRYDYTLCKEIGRSYLVTDSTYTNFELSMEWKISKNGNSGVFWGVIEDEKIDYPYKTGPEIQILDDNWKDYIDSRGDINRAGSLYNLMAPKRIVSKGAGIWNHFLIHIDHNENIGFVEFNSKEVLRFPVHGPEWEAMIARSGFKDWENFGKSQTGRISLQDHGGKVAFRNIKIRTLE